MSTTTRELLTSHGACVLGVAALGALIDLDVPLPCTPAWAIAVLAGELTMQQRVGWAVGRLCAPAEVGVVAGADLRGACLRWAVLHRAYLGGANLRGADLGWAYLCGADLNGADLSGANLAADLSNADLTGALRDPDDAPIPGWAVADGRLVRA